MKKILLITVLVIPLLYGCKKDPDPDPSDTPTQAERARDDLYDLMKYVYLWNDKIPTLKTSDYESPEDILEAMRYLPLDKYSFVADYDAFIAKMSGSFVGHGIRVGLDNANVARVVSLYKGSDLWPKGVRRGWIIKKVNGTDLAPIMINAITTGDWSAYNTLMGAATAGVTNTFLFQKPDGTDVTYTSVKASFQINSVTATSILDLSSGKTGYLCFETFIEPSEQELFNAFADFKANNVTDLIIDLRYNLGGYTTIAEQLASLVVDESYANKLMYKLNYNATIAPTWNESFNFVDTILPLGLGLDRVVFITTRSTASASEVVINSLKPYISVSLVGDTTAGKCTGMNLWGWPFPANASDQPDYKYVFAPITFEYVNYLNEGGFYDGMASDVLASDDVTHDFGDPEELSLKAAIAVLEGTKAASAVPFTRPVIRGEGRQLPENLFYGPLK